VHEFTLCIHWCVGHASELRWTNTGKQQAMEQQEPTHHRAAYGEVTIPCLSSIIKSLNPKPRPPLLKWLTRGMLIEATPLLVWLFAGRLHGRGVG